jgi:hypothetical protein
MAHLRPEANERTADGDSYGREGWFSREIRDFRITQAELDAGNDQLAIGLPQALER